MTGHTGLDPAERSPRHERLAGALVFLVALAVYEASPIRNLGDSRYTLLVSESLLDHGSFALDRYFTSPRSGVRQGAPLIRQLRESGGHLYYWYPPGSSVLSLPFVAMMRPLGYRATDESSVPRVIDEGLMQLRIAGVLIAGLVWILYRTARCLLSTGSSALVALGAGFGTPLLSTASRGLAGHAWYGFLLGWIILMLVRAETQRARLSPVLLATLASWLYFVRPTASLVIPCLTVYLIALHRPAFGAYAVTGAAWLCGFIAYSWIHYGELLPPYYWLGSRLAPGHMLAGLAGTLLSPSRGLLIFVPSVVFVVYLLIRYRSHVPLRPLARMALVASVTHILVLGAWIKWWGGQSYGPRLTSCIVPWLALLAALGLRARQDALAEGAGRRRLECAVGLALLCVSVLLNLPGAVSRQVKEWNTRPVLANERSGRLWEWQRPQFLAALGWPLPWGYPALPSDGRIELGSVTATPYLWGDWGEREGALRWTAGWRPTLIFAMENPDAKQLRMQIEPYLNVAPHQRIHLRLNGESIARISLDHPGPEIFSIDLPPHVLANHNRLELRLRDAGPKSRVSASTLSDAEDEDEDEDEDADVTLRRGVGVAWLEIR